MLIEYIKHKKTGGKFGPTSHDRYYSPAAYHNKNAEDRNNYKSKWSLPEPYQYCIFKYADDNDWMVGDIIIGINLEGNNHLMSLGTEEEKVALFRPNRQEKEDWHGYPVKVCEIDNRYDKFFGKLKEEKLISKSIYRKLVGKKI